MVVLKPLGVPAVYSRRGCLVAADMTFLFKFKRKEVVLAADGVCANVREIAESRDSAVNEDILAASVLAYLYECETV